MGTEPDPANENQDAPEEKQPAFDPSATMVYRVPSEVRAAAAAEDIWHIHVEVIGGPMDGLKSRVPRPSFTIGRGIGSDLPLPLDPMVSTRHARIVREGRSFWLEDLGSRNGVYLGDERLTERALIGPGTTFTVGQTQLEFMPR